MHGGSQLGGNARGKPRRFLRCNETGSGVGRGLFDRLREQSLSLLWALLGDRGSHALS